MKLNITESARKNLEEHAEKHSKYNIRITFQGFG